MYEIRTEDVCEKISKDKKKMFDFSNYSAKPKYYHDSDKLMVSKMENETGGVTIKKFIGLKPKIYSLLVANSSEHKKQRE